MPQRDTSGTICSPLGAQFQRADRRLSEKSGHAADPNALYVLWIGANDMSDAAVTSFADGGAIWRRSVGKSSRRLAIPRKLVTRRLTDILVGLLTLQTLGARNFLIGNSPDLSLTPAARGLAAYFGSGVSDRFPGASVGFNRPGRDAYTLPTSSVTLFDAFALQTAMTDNPAAYGLTNVTGPATTARSTARRLAGSATANECPNEGEYLYYDTGTPRPCC